MIIHVEFNDRRQGLHAVGPTWKLYPHTGSLIEDWKRIRDSLPDHTLVASLEVHSAIYKEFQVREIEQMGMPNFDWPAMDYEK